MRYTIEIEGDYITFIDVITGEKRSYRKDSFKSLRMRLADDNLVLVQVNDSTVEFDYKEVEDPNTVGVVFINLPLFRNYILDNIDISSGGSSGSGGIQGTVANYTSLPSPASDYTGELYYVTTASGGHWTRILKKNYYEHPAGLYVSNGSIWEQSTIQVQMSEDAQTLVNVTNWTEFLTINPQANIGDRIIYNRIQYENLTGTIIATAPDIDIVNWALVAGGSASIEDAKRYIFLMNN